MLELLQEIHLEARMNVSIGSLEAKGKATAVGRQDKGWMPGITLEWQVTRWVPFVPNKSFFRYLAVRAEPKNRDTRSRSCDIPQSSGTCWNYKNQYLFLRSILRPRKWSSALSDYR